MLEEKDFQAIGELLDEKLKVQLNERFKVQEKSLDQKLNERFKVQEKKIDEKFDEMAGLVNRGFTETQQEIDGVKEEINGVKGELNGVKEEIKLRPTKKEIFDWADQRLIGLRDCRRMPYSA